MRAVHRQFARASGTDSEPDYGASHGQNRRFPGKARGYHRGGMHVSVRSAVERWPSETFPAFMCIDN